MGIKNAVKIIKEKTVFNKKLLIEEGKISINQKRISQERVATEDAAAVLVFNTETKKIILIKQFRFAIASKVKEDILEIVAGKIEGGKDPLETAKNEVEEEIGYRIKDGNIKLLVSCFATPGYSTERYYIYYARVSEADKVSNGGGLKEENEFITVVEADINEFRDMIQKGEIKDAKTYIAALYIFCYESTLLSTH